MSNTTERKYIKTKFEGVFYRISAKRDPRTGEPDRVYCFWYADKNGKGHWQTVGRHSKGIRPQTARTARAKFLADLESGIDPVQHKRITVGQVIEAYIDWSRIERPSFSRQTSQYNKHIRPKLHNIAIADITPTMLMNIKKDMLQTPIAYVCNRKVKGTPKMLSPHTINIIFSFVRAAVNRAISVGMWNGMNPFATKRGGAWEELKVNNKRLRFFTPDEARALLAELKTRIPQLHDMALLSLRTGLRATEIFKLKRMDFDSHSNILHVIAKGGRRTPVRIPADIAEILAGYDRSPGEPIFKRPRTNDAFYSIPPGFKMAVKKLKLDPEENDPLYTVTFHTFRHTFASWLAQSGKVTLLELKALMRHQEIDMTLRYAHLIPGQESEKLSIIDGILAQSL